MSELSESRINYDKKNQESPKACVSQCTTCKNNVGLSLTYQYLPEVAEATLPCVATPAIAAFTLPASVVAVLGFEATKEDVRCLLELLLPALFIVPRT